MGSPKCSFKQLHVWGLNGGRSEPVILPPSHTHTLALRCAHPPGIHDVLWGAPGHTDPVPATQPLKLKAPPAEAIKQASISSMATSSAFQNMGMNIGSTMVQQRPT